KSRDLHPVDRPSPRPAPLDPEIHGTSPAGPKHLTPPRPPLAISLDFPGKGRGHPAIGELRHAAQDPAIRKPMKRGFVPAWDVESLPAHPPRGVVCHGSNMMILNAEVRRTGELL